LPFRRILRRIPALCGSQRHWLFGAHLITGSEHPRCQHLHSANAGWEQIRGGIALEGAETGTPTAGMGVSRERRAPVPVCGTTKMERFPQISSILEWNVVVSYCGSSLRTRLPAGHFSPAFLPAIPRTEQDNVPSDNLGSIFLSAVLPAFPGRCLQFAFHVELGSPADLLSHDLR
jgi:hypothetical protein